MFLLNKYKYYIIGVLFLVVAVFSWTVKGKIDEGVHLRKQLQQSELLIKEKVRNDELQAELIKALADKNTMQKTIFQDAWKEILNEVATNPVYKSCSHPDRVRNAIQKQLDSQ